MSSKISRKIITRIGWLFSRFYIGWIIAKLLLLPVFAACLILDELWESVKDLCQNIKNIDIEVGGWKYSNFISNHNNANNAIRNETFND
jgi:hypothetical protein